MAAVESVLEAALRDWKEREQRYEKLFSPSVLKSREFLKEKLRHYDELHAKVIAGSQNEDRLPLLALALERRQLAKQLYPNVFRRLLERIVSSIKLDRAITKLQQQSQNDTEGIRTAMIETGLGKYYNMVEQQMKQGDREFSLPVSYHVNEQERMDLMLNFKKDKDGRLQFESYKATLYSEAEKGKPKQQTFSMEKSMEINTDKAYNLLAGRAILNGNNGSWQQLDFNDRDAAGNNRIKHFPENYGFDLMKNLEGLPVKYGQHMDNIDRLMAQLGKGERIPVTLKAGNKEALYHIEANPQKREVAIYDRSGSKVSIEELKTGNKKENKSAKVKSLVPNRENTTAKAKNLLRN